MEIFKKTQIADEIKNLETKSFKVEEISLERGPYCMSFGFNLEPYARSIESVGMINSPTVVMTDKGEFVPVSGYRRIMAMHMLEKQNVFCRDLTRLGLSKFELFHINLEENLFTRAFNHVERGMVLNGLSKFTSIENIVKDYMPLLGLASRKSEFLFYTRMEKELDDNIKKLLAFGKISIHIVKKVIEFEKEIGRQVAEFISSLNLSMNKQKQLLEYIIDLSEMKDVDIGDILGKKEVEDLIVNENPNTPQKAKLLMRLFKSMRFPHLVEAEKIFETRVVKISLPRGVKIRHHPFFEAPDYTMEVSFRDGKNLMKKIRELEKIKGIEKLTDPWLKPENERE